MNDVPDTRHSLLLRLRNHDDELAWREFVQIYQPLIYRLVRSKGFQDADAQELAQEVIVAVASAIERWNPDPDRGSFRGWLFRTTRNIMINFLTRTRPGQRGTGDTDFHRFLDQHPDRSADAETQFSLEYRREIFRWAAAQSRDRFQKTTWQAFWETSVQGHSIPETAEALGLSVGAVYAARSRVMAEMKRKVERWEACQCAGEGDRS